MKRIVLDGTLSWRSTASRKQNKKQQKLYDSRVRCPSRILSRRWRQTHWCSGSGSGRYIVRVSFSLGRMSVRACGRFSRWLRDLCRWESAYRIFVSTWGRCTAVATPDAALRQRRACSRFTRMYRQNECLCLPQEITIIAESRYQWQIEISALFPKCPDIKHSVVLSVLLIVSESRWLSGCLLGLRGRRRWGWW